MGEISFTICIKNITKIQVSLYSFSGFCQYYSLIGDGLCDDETNTEQCDYDGGDCCVDEVLTSYCTLCECLAPSHISNFLSKYYYFE